MRFKRIIFVRHGNYQDESPHPTSGLLEQIDQAGLKQVRQLATQIRATIPDFNPEMISMLTSSAPRAREYGVSLAALLGVDNYEVREALWSDRDHPDTQERVEKATSEITMLQCMPFNTAIVVTHLEFVAKLPKPVYQEFTKKELVGWVVELERGQAMILNLETGTISVVK